MTNILLAMKESSWLFVIFGLAGLASVLMNLAGRRPATKETPSAAQAFFDAVDDAEESGHVTERRYFRDARTMVALKREHRRRTKVAQRTMLYASLMQIGVVLLRQRGTAGDEAKESSREHETNPSRA
jgi:hypothetical protein